MNLLVITERKNIFFNSSFFLHLGSRGRSVIQQAFDQYHKKTCLRFFPRKNERSYISFHAGGG